MNWLFIAIVFLLQGCGGGDPEPLEKDRYVRPAHDAQPTGRKD